MNVLLMAREVVLLKREKEGESMTVVVIRVGAVGDLN